MKATPLLAHFDRLVEAPDAVPRLRRFILDLAARGKLVEQDARDEPAECLLKQCELERAKAVKAGVVRKEKPPPILDDVPYPYPLPVGWIWTRLGSTGRIFNGDSVSESEKAELSKVADGYPFIATKDVGYGWQQLNYENGLRVPVGASALKVLRANSVLICAEGGSAGKKTGLTDRDICFGNKLFANEPWDGISASYLLALYQSSFFYKEFSSRMTGIIGGISRAEFVLLPVPIPPTEEQMRIVAKVNELMVLCDQLEAAQQERERRRDRLAAASLQRLNQPAADTTPEAQREHTRFHLNHLPRLTTRPEHIRAMRQTISNFAVHGWLVPQSPEESSAMDALDASRLRSVKDLESVKKTSELRKASDTGKPHTERMRSDVDGQFHLPSSWVWVNWECILASGSGSFKRGPFGSALTKAIFVKEGYKVYEQYCPINDDCSFARYYITPEKYEEMKGFAVKAKDFLISCSGVTLGRITQVPEAYEEGVINQALLRVRTERTLIDDDFFKKLFRSPYFQGKLFDNSTGTAIPNLKGVADLKAIPVPLPPLAEQHRIVAKVNALMALCDQLEAQLTTTQTDSRRLLEAVLETALI